MASLRQTDFSAGEVDPLYWGRTDLPFFPKGCRTLKNFIVTRHGAAASRPGTTFVGKTKYPDPAPLFSEDGYGRSVFIPFVIDDDESLVLEATFHCIRFFKKGARVVDGAGNPYELAVYTATDGTVLPLPYTFSALQLLKYAQIGDSILLTHPAYPAIELRRSGAMWSARQVDLSRPAPTYADVGTNTVTTAFGFVAPGAPGTHGTVADTDHPAREWQWMVTALVQDPATGEKYETKGELVNESWDGADFHASAAPLTSDNAAVFLDRPVTLRRGNPFIAAINLDLCILGYNIYRGRGGLFGFMGTTTSREFVDTGGEPDHSRQPPRGTNPFEVADASGALSRTENPVAVTHFQSRRVYGATYDPITVLPRRSQTLFLSAVEDFFNFDKPSPIDWSGEPLEETLASMVREEIRHLVPLNKLLIGTSCNWWSMNGGTGQPLDWDHVEAEIIDAVGVSPIVRPVIVDRAVLYARAKGVGVRALVPYSSYGSSLYQAFNVSQYAQHLFTGTGHSIVAMAYAEDPWGVLWVVRDDGVLLSLTFMMEGDAPMLAWARHEMDGQVEAVCCVPETDEDGVYLIVKRTINGVEQRYVERMTSRHPRGGAQVDGLGNLTTPPDYICVDAAKQYVGAAVQVFTGLDHLEGKNVYIAAQGKPVMGPYPVVGGQVDAGFVLSENVATAAGPRLVAFVGLPYVCDLELLDVAGGEARLKEKQVSHVCFEVDQSKGLKAGQDFEHLTQVPERDVADAFGAPALQTKTVKCAIKGKSDLSARACLRQDQPLPVTVVGITKRLVVGDDA